MKKILFTGLLIAVLGTVSLTVSKHIQQNNESSLIFENIEALAAGNSDMIECPAGNKIECARIYLPDSFEVHIYYKRE